MGGAPSAPKPAPTPPAPETVKRVESEVVRARNNAKSAASKRFGISGTDTTRGVLNDEDMSTKKQKLGGE